MPAALVQFQGTIGEELNKLVNASLIREIAQTPTLPPGVPELTIDDVKNTYGKPWYKRWWVWTLAGVAVVGTGLTVVLVRKRKKKR